jgi:hypothetical protein
MISELTENLLITDGTYALGDRNDPDSPLYHVGAYPSPDVTGLLATAPGFLAITCGTGMGTVEVIVELWDGPPVVDLDTWDDVAEASITWPRGRAEILRSDIDEAEDVTLDLPATDASSYRVRGFARNRDAGEDRGPDDPVEQHLIQIWPAVTQPDTLLKATDATGALWRGRHR